MNGSLLYILLRFFINSNKLDNYVSKLNTRSYVPLSVFFVSLVFGDILLIDLYLLTLTHSHGNLI